MLSFVLGTVSGLTALQGALFFAECLLGARPNPSMPRLGDSAPPLSSGPPSSSRRLPVIAVLVPAHDEELGIAATLDSIRADLWEGDRLVVVADNCGDDTARIAEAHGAEVLIRTNPDERGKGYAIHFAIDALRSNPPEVVVILDADCRVEVGTVGTIAREALRTGCPIQADYLLHAPPGTQPSTQQRISEFALRVRNRVRLRGGRRLGIPSALTGSGMAFPWKVISEAPSMKGNIVEDLALGVELALLGTPPLYCGSAGVSSVLPTGSDAAKTQRSRWESGHLATLFGKVPRLLSRGVTTGRRELLMMGWDLSIPPLSLLVATQGLLVWVGSAALLIHGAWLPLLLSSSGFGFVALGVWAAWRSEGRHVLPARQLLGIPGYALRKLPRYLKFFARGPERNWVRTKREAS